MTVEFSSRRRVAGTRLDLPVFGFGSAHLGEMYATVAESDSVATLEAAWAGGVRYYDTAPWYGRGLSEHRTGAFLRTKPRGEFRISTKVGRTLHRPDDPKTFDRAPWTGGLNFEVRFDYSYDGLMRAYEQALQRLALDTVDALVIHDLDAEYHEKPALDAHRKDLSASGMKALEELKKAGDIAAYGMGINTGEALETTASEVDLDFVLVAMPYTLIDQAVLHTGMKRCIERDVSVVIGAPFASGILATGSKGSAKYGYAAAPAGVQEKVRGIEAVCESHGVSLAAAALQFPLAHPAVVSIIPGSTRPGEVEQNIASVQTPIPGAFWEELLQKELIDPEAPVPAGN